MLPRQGALHRGNPRCMHEVRFTNSSFHVLAQVRSFGRGGNVEYTSLAQEVAYEGVPTCDHALVFLVCDTPSLVEDENGKVWAQL